jgi:predicted DNA-binding transcriptional regulator AlpA
MLPVKKEVNMEEKLLTSSEVAARWGVHKATVFRLYHDGLLPGILLSRTAKRVTIRFRLKTIEEWENRREEVDPKTVGK